MNTVCGKNGGEFAYLRLYRSVREAIVSGVYPYGARLPSKRSVAERESVSVITVEHAYSLLCEEGYAEARERSGYFVIFTTDGGFASAAPVPERRQAHSQRRSDLPGFSFPILARAMRRVINDYGEEILDRPPNGGCLELKEAIRSYLARNRGITAKTEQIIIGSGSEYLYGLIVALLGREKIYAAERPSYKKIEQVYKSAGVRCELLPLGADGIESAGLWASGADVLHISPYRSFPSGVTATASKRHEYMRWAAEGNRYIVEDDFESEFTPSKKQEETLFALSERENVIYINTFSKTVSPSFRIGYMILPEALVPVFEEKVGFYSCTVPTYMQLVLAQLISCGDLERHINRVRRNKRNFG